MKPKTIAIIPARKGSKRLPGKNRKLLNGVPLIDYTLNVAIACQFIDEIIVITDDLWIKAYCLGYKGISRIIDEPEEIAQNSSQAWEVVKYVMEFLISDKRERDNTTIIYLQPTSPLRTDEDLSEAYDLFNANYREPVASVVYKRDMDTIYDKWDYMLNGAIYITPYHEVINCESLWRQAKHLYVMPSRHSVNIDYQLDLDSAEWIIQGNKDVLQRKTSKIQKQEKTED